MKGTHRVTIKNKRVRYQFDLRRNITIVRGNSGTGKTTLYDLVVARTRLGQSSGVNLSCDKECVGLVDIDWQNQLRGIEDSIVFVDEGARYVTSHDFAKAIQNSSNYYVIFTREPLHQLPYSIDEVYHIKTSGKFHSFEREYRKRAHHVYGTPGKSRRNYDTLLTEDSKSGLMFYQKRFADKELECETSGGRSAIYDWLKRHAEQNVFVIADGAAFGDESERVMALQAMHPDSITICLPESFEWLLLSSRVVGDTTTASILDNPSDYIESADYESWEQFFTHLLQDVSAGTPFAYSKEFLPDAWAVEVNANKVMELIRNKNIR